MPKTLFDEMMAPEIEPTEAYSPSSEVVQHRFATPPLVVLEIHKKGESLLGFRYQAWVAWRDADNTAHSHSWWEIEPAPLLTNSIEEARTVAEAHATAIGILLCGIWIDQTNSLA